MYQQLRIQSTFGTTIEGMTTGTQTPWLNADQQRSWRSFLGGTTVLNDQLDRDLHTKHGVSLPEYEILVRLSEAEDGQVRMADLAAAVAHSRSRITHTIARLQRAGLVERAPCSDDGRGVCAILTEHGQSVLEEAAHTHVNGVADYFVSKTTPEEFAIIGTVFERIRNDLEGKTF